jgi:hypothetical protein
LECSISSANRFNLVSSFFALMTHQLQILRYPGGCAWKNAQAAGWLPDPEVLGVGVVLLEPRAPGG